MLSDWRNPPRPVEKLAEQGSRIPTGSDRISIEQLRGMGLHRLMGTVKYPVQATPEDRR